MAFNSYSFWLLFICVYALYLAVRQHIVKRNVLLLIASYGFYAIWDWRFLGLIIAVTAINYHAGLLLQHAKNRKRVLWITILMNVGILGFFKYCNFFVENLQLLGQVVGVRMDWPTLNIILPIGISFYIFQALSYTIDVYKKDTKPTKNVLNFAVFVAFFPQLVAGPIERASSLLRQFESHVTLTQAHLSQGLFLIVWGLLKKLVIADNAGLIVNALFEQIEIFSVSALLLAGVAFTLQIYGDFSGYSNIARGLASCMGFKLSRNFQHPYLASSPSDFWRRWHITLSEWFRDYVYIPLGGNRKGPRRTICNLICTMALVGLWHGAQWTFVLWGVFHGLLLILYKAAQSIRNINVPNIFSVPFYFCISIFGWLLFRATSLQQIVPSIAHVGDYIIPDSYYWYIGALWLLLLVVEWWQVRSKDEFILTKLPTPIQLCCYLIAYVLLVVFASPAHVEFIYFQF